MSIFGAVYLGAVLAAKAIGGVKDTWDDCKGRATAENAKELYYYDHKGQMRLTSNGRCCYIRPLNGHEMVLFDDKGNWIHNYADDKRETAKQRAIANGESVYLYTTNRDHPLWKKHHDWIYKDIETGELYHIFNDFYCDENGYYIRPTDSSLKAWEKRGILKERLKWAEEYNERERKRNELGDDYYNYAKKGD